jgi:hypothetical protein
MVSGIMELRLKGYCCSQIIMEMGLRGFEKENEDLVKSMAGLCGGIHQGKECGCLSSAICLIYLVDQAHPDTLTQEMIDWFFDSYGTTECDALLDGNPLNKTERCGGYIENTYLRLIELFESHGIDFQPEP